MSGDRIKIEVLQGDVLEFKADVLALKFAQHFYGSDAAIAARLSEAGIAQNADLQPAPGAHVWVDSQNALPTPTVLFVGVPPLINFRYTEIEEFTFQAFSLIAQHAPNAQHVALTLHGPGYGLDEIESLHAELRGIWRAVESAAASPKLVHVTILERQAERVTRLQEALAQVAESMRPATLSPSAPPPADVTKLPPAAGHGWPHLPSFRSPAPVAAPAPSPAPNATAATPLQSTLFLFPNSLGAPPAVLQTAQQVEMKPSAFVAMPFAPEMEDVYYYGIQNPVRQLGYKCERVDQEAFTGDILQRVKTSIENATVVIADLTGANANVYLEVGYAWGKSRPTILLLRGSEELKFDVRGQRCLKYQSIKELETRLTEELKKLSSGDDLEPINPLVN